jgi:hypothetical protein
MLRLIVPMVLLASAVAVAAPVPPAPEKERIAALYGKTEGPGTFSLVGTQFTLRTSGEPACNARDPKQKTLPRTSRTLTGDFEVSVRVLDAPPPDTKAKLDPGFGGKYDARAGLYILGGDYYLSIDLWQCYYTREGKLDKQPSRRLWVSAWFTDGSIVSLLDPVEDGKSPEFRITRKDKKVSVTHRFGDGVWLPPHVPRVKQEFPDEVTVGVYLSHSTHQSLHATFDRFTVRKLPAPGEKK